MDWQHIGQYFTEQVLGYIVAAVFALLWYRARTGEKVLVAKLRAYADKLPTWQHDLIESFIVKAQVVFADYSGSDRMQAVVNWMQEAKVPVNAAYVQSTYNALAREGKLADAAAAAAAKAGG